MINNIFELFTFMFKFQYFGRLVSFIIILPFRQWTVVLDFEKLFVKVNSFKISISKLDIIL